MAAVAVRRLTADRFVARFLPVRSAELLDGIGERLVFDPDFAETVPRLGIELADPAVLLDRLLRLEPDPLNIGLVTAARVIAELPEAMLPDVEEQLAAVVHRTAWRLDPFGQEGVEILTALEPRLAGRERPLLDALDQGFGQEREHAVFRLRAVSANPEVQSALLDRLAKKSEGVRRWAAFALREAPADARLREALLTRLHDSRPEVRAAALIGLRNLVDDETVRTAVHARLADDEWEVRLEAARCLEPAAAHPPVQRALLERTRDDNINVRRAAVRALGGAASQPDVLSTLLDLLSDPELGMDAHRALSAANLSQDANDAHERELAKTPGCEDLIRQAARRRLVHQSLESASEAAKQALLDYLRDEDFLVRAAAARGLAPYVSETNVRTALLAQVRRDEPKVAAAAVEVLATLSFDEKVRAELLRHVRHSVNPRAAIAALAAQGACLSQLAAQLVSTYRNGSGSGKYEYHALRRGALTGLRDVPADSRSEVLRNLDSFTRIADQRTWHTRPDERG